jgi:hypothetical protein
MKHVDGQTRSSFTYVKKPVTNNENIWGFLVVIMNLYDYKQFNNKDVQTISRYNVSSVRYKHKVLAKH